MRCSGCGFDNPTEMKFCGNCAQPLAPVCPSCGFANPPGFKFCGECAAPLVSRDEADGKTPGPAAHIPQSNTPKHLADKILQSKSALEGELKQVTVLAVLRARARRVSTSRATSDHR